MLQEHRHPLLRADTHACHHQNGLRSSACACACPSLSCGRVCLQAALAERGAEVEALAAARDGLKADLDALLAQRVQLDAMRAMVVKAMAGGLPLPAGAAAGAGASGARRPAVGSTTIISGEGF